MQLDKTGYPSTYLIMQQLTFGALTVRNKVEILYSDHPPNDYRSPLTVDSAHRNAVPSDNRMYLPSYCPKGSSSSSTWFLSHPLSNAPDVSHPHERTSWQLHHEELAIIVYDLQRTTLDAWDTSRRQDITTVIRSHDANTTKQRTEQQRRRPHPLQYSRSVQSANPAVSS